MNLSGAFPALDHLELSQGQPGDDGLEVLLASPGAARLISIELRRNAITVKALTDSRR